MITRLLALSVVLLWGWNLPRAAQQQVGTETACPPQVPNSFCVLYRGDESFTSNIAFSADGQLIATAFVRDSWTNPVIRVWKVSGQLVYKLQGHISDISDVSFSPDGKLLASSSFGGVIKLWDVASGREIRTLKPSYGFNGAAMAFSPNGRLLASTACVDSRCEQEDIILWDLGSGAEVSRISMANELSKELVAHKIFQMAFASDELLIAKLPASITIWNVRTRRLIQLLFFASGYDMAVSPARQLVAAKSIDNIMIWRIPSGEEFSSIKEGEFGGVISLSFSPDGRFLAGGRKYFPNVQDKRFVQIWKVGDKTKGWQVARTLTIPLPEHGLLSTDFSLDGKLLAIRAFAYNKSEEIMQLWYVGDLR